MIIYFIWFFCKTCNYVMGSCNIYFTMMINCLHTQCKVGLNSLYFRDAYPMLLVANKIDLVRQRKVSEEQGRSLAAHLRVKFNSMQTFCRCIQYIYVTDISGNSQCPQGRGIHMCMNPSQCMYHCLNFIHPRFWHFLPIICTCTSQCISWNIWKVVYFPSQLFKCYQLNTTSVCWGPDYVHSTVKDSATPWNLLWFK